MIDYDHPNSPYFDDSYLDIEVWRIEVTVDGEVIDETWELGDNVERGIRDMQREYPGCEVKITAHELRDCPPEMRKLLYYIEGEL